MGRKEAEKILNLPKEEAIKKILEIGNKAEKYDQLHNDDDPTTPSGMKPPYSKPPGKKRKRKPGRKKGHKGAFRPKPDKIDHHKEHTLSDCPKCHNAVNDPVSSYTRYTEDIPPVEPEVTEHIIYGYWCRHCRKIVYPKVTDALPNANIGLRLVVFTAWLHYLVGVSVNNIVRLLSTVMNFNVSAGGLTQAWKKLALTLEPVYVGIAKNIKTSAVLNADETGWRVNGMTHWLWCFATKNLCYYVIDRSRGSPVLHKFFGKIFHGILICDFWGAYNKLCALAKQRCFFHLFTELVKVDKRNQSAEWAAFRKKLSRLLKDAIRLQSNSQLTADRFTKRKQRLYFRLEKLTASAYEDKDVCRLIKRLKRHKDEMFTFLDHKGVSPYNNHGEQQMRKPAIARKISHQNRSNDGAKTQAILMSILRSVELQEKNPVETTLLTVKKLIHPAEIIPPEASLII